MMIAYYKEICDCNSLKKFWSGKRDLNPRPLPWQGNALPTELFPHIDNSLKFSNFDKHVKPLLAQSADYTAQKTNSRIILDIFTTLLILVVLKNLLTQAKKHDWINIWNNFKHSR